MGTSARSTAFTEAGLEHRGTKPGFLLVHGLGGARQQWLAVQRELASHAYSIAVDVPGFGSDRTSRERFEVGRATQRVAEFVAARGLEGSILVSHSIGSTVAALLAADPTLGFRRLIIVSGTLFRATRVAQRPWLMVFGGRLGLAVGAQFLVGSVPVTRPMRRLVASSTVLRWMGLWPFVAEPGRLDPTLVAEALEGSGSKAVLRILLDARRIDFESMIRAVPCPVDLIWGARDRLINADDVATATRLCKIVNRHEIGSCGHWPMIESTGELVSLLLKWGFDESNP